MIRRPPRSTQGVSSAASDVYKRQVIYQPSFPNLIHIKEVGKTSSHFYFVMKKDPKARNILEAIFSNEVEIMEITLRLMLFPLMKTLCLSLIHISEPTRPLYISYAVFCLKKKNKTHLYQNNTHVLLCY
eukprot:TRINITY_DN23413_c0_g1_i4.p1 TRINITY_DN23413_c0_g1~~TRINITY_DN23413_c0_g1_i4.p1  ORF type:complete len:129 (-),score=30.29 TRINITY_DN23413_c0_g1_i4:2-388(-)